MSFIVALTGGIGSGKSTVANYFQEKGVPIIDADIIAREIVEPASEALKAIQAHFGDEIIQANGTLDRKALRNIVFTQPEQKQWLNALLHPLIEQETLRRFSASRAPYLIWAIPLLIENHLTHLADRILVVDVTEETQIKRTTERDNSSETVVNGIIAAQVSREVRLSYADDTINNDGDITLIPAQVDNLHRTYLRLAKAKSCHK